MSRFVTVRRSLTRGSIAGAMLMAVVPIACGNQPDTVEVRQSASIETPQTALDGATVPKYVEALPVFSNRRSNGSTTQNIDMVEFQQRILPASIYAALPAPFNAGSFLWGYKINSAPPSWPSVTIETHGNATSANYRNLLEGPNGARPVLARYLTVDQTLHWADPLNLTRNNHCVNGPPLAGPCVQPYTGPIPAVTHLHGAEVPSPPTVTRTPGGRRASSRPVRPSAARASTTSTGRRRRSSGSTTTRSAWSG